MEENNELEVSQGTKRAFSIFTWLIALFYSINLFAFLDLFFGIVLPNFGRSDFGHYFKIVVILAIMASVGENLRRRKSGTLIIGFTVLLFIVNVYAVWRNWFYH